MDKDFIPFIAFESAQTRLERTIKRLWILCILVLLLLVATNMAWVIYEKQWQYVETTTQDVIQDGSGTNIVGGGDINYGTASKDIDN